ncbi:F-box protein SKIP31 isoform X1 [Coffea arabica]|uniref:F-box protein SKIP31 isoform X1 n=1 Tax=Coffea arabica TaxID=13443 RepID=A0A6P6TPX7_COFAR|nr:F-box protein SKIP31-like isoform X1 [Coffea arabica]
MAPLDDEDESLARFLESEVLSEFSDQEDEKREEKLEEEDDDGVVKRMLVVEDDYSDEVEEESDAIRKLIEEDDISEEVEMRKEEEENEEEEEKQVNKMLIEEGGISCEDDEKEGEEREVKKRRIEEVDNHNEGQSMILSSCQFLSANELVAASLPSKKIGTATDVNNSGSSSESRPVPWRVETGDLSKVPPELFRHILKFLSSEDLVACSLVCRFLNLAASDESLWRRLYWMRWGLLPPKKLREFAWKKLYIQRDEEDMVELVRNCPSEFKEYYIQMQAAKRSQAPLPSQVLDDQIIIDKTVTDQVSTWKSSRGLTDKVVVNHACSGETCTYYQIGDVFVCEKTGNVHVCDDTCKEVVADPANELLVCTISGRCFDRLLSPSEMEPDAELQQGGVTDEAEPFWGSGRFARAYQLGYNCADEKELEATLRFC